MRRSALLLTLLLLIPLVPAEFGDEADGYPVNVDGETIFPYIPQDWADRHPELVDDLLAGRVNLDGSTRLSVEPLNKVNGYTVFPYYPLLTAELQRLAQDHPDLVRLTSAGQSHLGLDLWLLEIADFSNPDAVPLTEREVVYLDGGTHSNEYSGVYFVTEWAQFLLDEYETNETAKWIVENRHTFILPLVNPDGSNVFGRINALTVNVNRNFPSTWGTVASDTWPLNWPGPYPASEPETQSIVNLMDDIRPDFVDSIHCCGNLWLHPYGAEHLGHAPDFEMFSNMCRVIFPDLTVDVDRIQCGETWSTIYPASGTTLDEGYGRVGASSWSYEMSGRGAIAPWGQPVIADDPRAQEIESWRGVMHGFLEVERYGANPRVVGMEVNGDLLEVSVLNDGYGNISVGTLQVGGVAVSLANQGPGQVAVYELPLNVQEGDLPVHIEWKKRLHPQSNWGDLRFSIPVDAVDGALEFLLPEPVAKPGMGSLLPESAGLLREDLAPLQAQGAVGSYGAPSVPIFLVVVALAALMILRRKA